MMIFIVPKVKKCIWKYFRSMELDLESFGLMLKMGYGKLKIENDRMS